jgi:hypothetical protein
MKYLFDANVFIEAKNRYYAFDICPGFWDWIDHVAKTDAGSVVPVCEELRKGKDELAKWADDRRSMPWFLKIDDTETQNAMKDIAAFVGGQGYSAEAQAHFLAGADPWLIAKARTIGAKVVTHEVSSPGAKKRVPIPDICIPFGIDCIPPYDVLRTMAASFTFRTPA